MTTEPLTPEEALAEVLFGPGAPIFVAKAHIDNLRERGFDIVPLDAAHSRETPGCGCRDLPDGSGYEMCEWHAARARWADPLRSRESALVKAITHTAIPSLLVFAEGNAGVRNAIEVLRAAVEDDR